MREDSPRPIMGLLLEGAVMSEAHIRQLIERAIVRRLIEEAIGAGFTPVAVFNGDEYIPTPNIGRALDVVFDLDECTLHFGQRGAIAQLPEGWGCYGVLIILGNGIDCISDWHCGDDAFNTAVERVCDAIENPGFRVTL
jgi:hypothetical protein